MTRRQATTMMAIVTTLLAMAACRSPRAALTMQVDAQRIAADLHLQFARALDQSGVAVLADRDADATAAAHAAEAASSAVIKDVMDLRPLLDQLGYAPESKLLQSFDTQFGEYRRLESEILSLAVENTNAKAQQLAFGSGREAADAFVREMDAVAKIVPSNARVDALTARATAAVREIQAVEPRHIAEAGEREMTGMEAELRTAEGQARTALTSLKAANIAGAQTHLDQASAALDRFLAVNTELLALSRRNSNVRSTALSLGKKRILAGQCDDLLRQLEEALAAHDFTGTR